MAENLYAEWKALGDARDLIATIHGDLVTDQARLRGSVDGLLDTWHGRASTAYSGGWSDWTADADELLASLHTMSELIGLNLASFHVTEEGVTRDVSVVHGRLGGA